MQLLKNASIKKRLTYIIMSISCISVLLTTLTISLIGIYKLRDNLISELDLLATIAGDSNQAALDFDDSDLAQRYIDAFKATSSIVQACIYDHKSLLGNITDQKIARYYNGEYRNAKDCPTDLTVRTTIDTERVELMRMINGKDGDIAGYIYIESTLQQIDEYIRKQSIIALSVIFTGIMISYLLAISLQKAISVPILRLADTAKQVSLNKDYSIRAKVMGSEKEDKNELVVLTTAFNEMLSEIGARNQQLKKQNVDLEKAKDAAESANRAKSQFLANISHELRTPLNAIIGFSSILMNQLFGPLGDNKYLEYAKDINDSGTHLLDIINDILDLSKAEAGKLSITYEEVHVGKSINKCMTILAERAEKGKVTVTVDVSKSLPFLIADRLRFIQIVLNIMSNAIKFTEPGGKVHISAKTIETAGEITHFIISVQDNGIGMSQEDLEKAFQSFGQVDSGLNRKYEGTGLGLPLTRKLIELHHGKIEMESELGKGTIVRLIFPATPPAEAGYNPLE